MAKYFNVEGSCMPDEHYMVPMDERLDEIENFINQGKYFTVNRARQYGKTTMLQMLCLRLKKSCHVFFISLEGADRNAYADAASFARFFCGLLYDKIIYGETQEISEKLTQGLKSASMKESGSWDFRDLGNFIAHMCADLKKPVVLIIDEADQAGGYEVFLDFLGMLRDKYLKRKNRPTFQSVILSGIYDIKNMNKYMQKEKECVYNSPWNIGADFLIDMNFSPEDIRRMLQDYEKEHMHSGGDGEKTAFLIYEYTCGYPYLVSRICKLADERISGTQKWRGKSVWCQEGILDAIKLLVKEPCSLFDDMRKKLDDYPKLREIVADALFNGVQIPFHSYHHVVDIGLIFWFLKEKNDAAVVSNRIFEMFFIICFCQNRRWKA